MLPTYSRTSGTGNVQLSSKLLTTTRKALRTREKFLILLLFATLGFVCLGGFFYLPDNFVQSDKVRAVYQKIQNAGPEMFMQPPPVVRRHRHGIDTSDGDTSNGDDSHISNDRDRLNAKINNEWIDDGHLEKPKLYNGVVGDVKPVQVPTTPAAEQVVFGIQEDNIFRPNGEDKDPIARERRDKVKEVSLSASYFTNYDFSVIHQQTKE